MDDGEVKSQIFAYKSGNGYVAESVDINWEETLSSLEYQDVKDGEYQLWEYPSGKIFSIVPDRELDEDQNQYSTPYTTKGTIWLPILVEADRNKEKVAAAYQAFKS